MDLAAHFNVMQTPTTLVLDRTGKVQARIGGAPKLNVIQQELAKLEIKVAHQTKHLHLKESTQEAQDLEPQ